MSKNNNWIKIENQFASNCITCDKEIPPGEDCLWMQNLGVKHIESPTGIEPEESQLVVIEEEDKERLGMK